MHTIWNYYSWTLSNKPTCMLFWKVIGSLYLHISELEILRYLGIFRPQNSCFIYNFLQNYFVNYHENFYDIQGWYFFGSIIVLGMLNILSCLCFCANIYPDIVVISFNIGLWNSSFCVDTSSPYFIYYVFLIYNSIAVHFY